jgi:drug/metabolite transporter (DMT)-like permease
VSGAAAGGNPAERPGWPVHAALAGAQLGFALFPIFGKLGLASIPPFVFAAVRVVAATLLLEILRRLTFAEPIARSDRKKVLLFALLGVSFNQVLFIFGLSLTTAINTTILTSTIPIFTLAAAVLLGFERLTARAALALALAGAGALLLLDVHRFDASSGSLRGNGLLLANALSYSLYLVLSRPLLARYRVLPFVAAVFRYGAVLIVLMSLPALSRFSPAAVPPLGWACLAAVVLLCTVLPYLLNSWALARTDASRVAFYVFLQPLISPLLAILVLGEVLSARTLTAALVILAGLAVSMLQRRLPARPLP